MKLDQIINRVDQLKSEINALRPIAPEQERRILQKFRLDWNYHSNAIEGNRLTLGETRAFLLHGITAHGKPFRDYLDIRGHNEAIAYLEDFVRGQEILTEAHIRELHKILLVESYEVEAITPDGQPTKRRVNPGHYKTRPNHVKTSTGEIHYYATPEETPAKMGDLMKWYRKEMKKGDLHPLILAATFHYRFVAIHPFDDGNGRMARLLMNLILMQAGYVPVIVRIDSREDYLLALEKADVGELEDFVVLIGQALLESLELYLRGARGESIEELEDLDKKIALLQKKLEGDKVITPAEKGLETQRQVLNNLIYPLSEKMLLQFAKFERFFNRAAYSLTWIRSDQQVELDHVKRAALLNNLSLITSNQEVDKIQIDYQLISFVKRKDYNIELHLIFNLRKYEFDVLYSLDTLDLLNPEDSLLELTSDDYSRIYTAEEINDFALTIGAKVYELIEQQANK